MELRPTNFREVLEHAFRIQPVAAYIVQLFKIRRDRPKRTDIACDTLFHRLGSSDVDPHLQHYRTRDRAFLTNIIRNAVPRTRLEQVDDALVNRMPSLAVASTSTLNHAVHSGKRAVHDRKIDIDTGLDQARCDHPAGFSSNQPQAYLGERLLSMNRMHERGQMEHAVSVIRRRLHQIIEGFRLTSTIDDAKHLFTRRQPVSEHRIFDLADEAILSAPQTLVQSLRLGSDLAHRTSVQTEHLV